MSRKQRLGVVAAVALTLTSLPTTSFAYPLSTPDASQLSRGVVEQSPLRNLLRLVAREQSGMWSALEKLYADSYVSTSPSNAVQVVMVRRGCKPTC